MCSTACLSGLQTSFTLDRNALLEFTTCAFIQSPLNFLWQEKLEHAFPGNNASNSSSSEGKQCSGQLQKPTMNARNTLAKVVLDQTVGAAWNTVLFVVTIGLLRGQSLDANIEQLQAVRYLPARLFSQSCLQTSLKTRQDKTRKEVAMVKVWH